MCGIAGYRALSSGQAGLEERLAKASERMVRRGPDGHGTWHSSDGSVGLAHRRLSIIDLSPGGAQPMHEEDIGLHITYNGEVYNYRELRDELESKGHRFRTQSDTEVLLRMYAEYGEGMFGRLVGMFGLAIYDERDRSIVLARGPVGIKPLYFAWEGNVLWFASQVKALLEAGVDDQIDPAGLTGFLLWGHVPSGLTLYKKIREVAPGTSVRVTADGSSTVRRYFDFVEELQRQASQIDVLSPDDAAESFGEEVRATVRRHFVADVPVSVFLSAGRDSSTLVALASEVLPEPPHAVTLGFREYAGTEWDEVPIAREVAAAYGCPHHVIEVGADDFREEKLNILDAMDQPSVDGVNTYFVSRAATKAGFKVALSGL
ncbi:MAG: asparagine synthase (glutamine-hydrolyzing), partial [Fimbriimonadaceae bacterium]